MFKLIKSIVYIITTSIYIILLLTLEGCKYKIYSKNDIYTTNNKSYIIKINSFVKYDYLDKEIKKELKIHNINYIDDIDTSKTILPTLNIVNVSEKYITTSVFINGVPASNQIILQIKANISVLNKNLYPINIKIYRYLYNNESTQLINDSEKFLIRQEIYEEAAHKITTCIYSYLKNI